MKIASLPMYQHQELEAAHKRYWALIRKNLLQDGINAPQNLSQDREEFSVWCDPELVLSQTCGMPFKNTLRDRVTLVGTPDYGLEQCPPGYYRSAVVVRADDPRQSLPEFRNTIFAYNQENSQSGYGAPFEHLRRYGFWFEKRLQANQHIGAARAVADGDADIAALDAVSWRIMGRYESFARRLRVLEWTNPTPGLPYISAAGINGRRYFTAIELAIGQLGLADRKLLGIRGIVFIPAQNYFAVPDPVIN